MFLSVEFILAKPVMLSERLKNDKTMGLEDGLNSLNPTQSMKNFAIILLEFFSETVQLDFKVHIWFASILVR